LRSRRRGWWRRSLCFCDRVERTECEQTEQPEGEKP
jgi:hypothetical protein